MKRRLYSIITLTLIFTVSLFGQLGYEENFNDGTVPTEWASANGNGGPAFELIPLDTVLKIYETPARENKWTLFTATLSGAIDISANPIIKFNARCDAGMAGAYMAIYFQDESGTSMAYGDWNGTQKQISDTWTEYTYDFTDRFNAVDSTSINRIHFRINTWPFTDTLYIDYIRVGLATTSANREPSITQEADIPGLFTTSGTQTVNLSGITYGTDATAQVITVSAASDNTAVVNNVNVTYTSPDATATLTFDPVGEGSADITVTVQDDGGTAGGGIDTKTMTFTVDVTDISINSAPTINSVANKSYLTTDAGSKVVSISGIGDGDAAHTQSISVSASAPANTIISNLNTVYSSDDAIGSVTYDVTGTVGTVTITVTVQDGAEGTSSGTDITTTTFDVIVLDPGSAGVFDNFDDNDITGWGATNYDFTGADGEIQVYAHKAGSDGFTYSFSPVDLSTAPYLNFKIRIFDDPQGRDNMSPINISYVYLIDVNGNLTSSYKVNRRVLPVDNMYEMSYDFTGHFETSGGDVVDMTQISSVLFCFNQSYYYYGTVAIDDLKLGSFATPKPLIENIYDQQVEMNSGTKTVLIRELYDGTEDGTDNPISISATSSNPSLVPDPVVTYTVGDQTGSLAYTPVTGQNGTATITVTVSASGADDQVITFDIDVENNMMPTLNAIDDQFGAVGIQQSVNFEGVSDGNKSVEQTIIVSATSLTPAIIPNPITVEYTSAYPTGRLLFTPSAQGSATIEVTVQDDGGTANGGVNTTTTSFDVTVYATFNFAPTIDEISNYEIFRNTSNNIYNLSGISDGDGGTQNLTITVTSSNTAVVPDPVFTHTPGTSIGTLSFTPVADSIGSSVITITMTDDGGDIGNNGNQTLVKTFNVNVLPIPPTGWTEEFDGPNEYIEPVNWGGLSLSFSGGEMTVTSTNRYRSSGMMYYFPERINIKDNPYMTFEVNIPSTNQSSVGFSAKPYCGEEQAQIRIYSRDGNPSTRFIRVSDGVEVSTMQANVWYNVIMEWEDGATDGQGRVLDLSKVDSMNIIAPEGDIFNSIVNGSMIYRNFKIGDEAYVPGKQTRPSIDQPADMVLFENPGEQTITLKGITDGVDGTVTPTFVVSSNNTTLIPSISKTAVDGNGEATITFTPSGTGEATVTLVVSATNATADRILTFNVEIFDAVPSVTTDITLDLSTRYQKIEGFGFSEVPEAFADLYINDLGASSTKKHSIQTMEIVNDNSDPNVLDMSAMDISVLEIGKLKKFQEMGLEHICFNPLTPPSWMKDNFIAGGKGYGSADYPNTLTKLSLQYYEEYAEYLVACLTAYKENGVDIYGISLQNEPSFEVTYGTCVYNDEALANLLAVVGPKIEAAGFGDVKIFGANQVFTQTRSGYSPVDYLAATQANPGADPYLDAFSVHGYSPDGIGSASASRQQWIDFYNQAQLGANPKTMWVMEGGVFGNSWEDAMTLSIGHIDGLKYGKVSNWVHWTLVGNVDTENACVGYDGVPTQRYYACKNFYKYIRPGADQVESTSSSDSILVVSFENDAMHGGDLTTVLVNVSHQAVAIDLSVTNGNVPSTYEVYRTDAATNFEMVDILGSGDIILVPPRSLTTIVGKGNAAPTIDDIADQYVAANAGNTDISLTNLSDGDGMTQGLTITVTSDNETVIPEPTITYTYPGTTGTLTYNPAGSGTANIEVTVTDGGSPVAGVKVVSFTINVSAVNSAPTVNTIADLVIDEDDGEQTVTLTGITDGDIGAQAITVSLSGGDGALFSTPLVTYSGGTTADITFTPVPDANGNADITVTLQDNGGTANGGVDTYEETFNVLINAVNDEPGIDPIADQAVVTNSTINVDLSGIVDNDPEEAQTLTVTASSSNPGNCPDPTVTYTSDNETGSLAITPTADGTYTITVTVSDDGGTANSGDDEVQITFDLFASATINNNPTINAIADEAINEDAGAQSVSLAGISDGDGGTQTVTLVAISSNTALVADPNITFISGDATATLNYTPAAGISGTATITVTVADDGTPNAGEAIRTFDIVVASVNDAPVIDAIADPATIAENSSEQTINLTGIADGDDGLQGISITATSSNTALISTVNVDYTSGATGTLTYTPESNQNGTTTIIVTVSDDGGTANGGVDETVITFDVVVSSFNSTPTADGIIPPTVLLEDASGTNTVNITGITDGGDGGQTLTLTAYDVSADGPKLTNIAVNYTSPATTATVDYDLLPNANGDAVLMVVVTDDGGTANGSVDTVYKEVTQVITAINDAPTIDAVADQTLGNGQYQIVSATGVSDGDPEVEQVLSFDIVSDNTTLIELISYSEASNSITMKLADGLTGTATVTLTITDDGGTSNGGVDETVITFDVNVVAASLKSYSADKMKIYPNPAGNFVNVQTNTFDFNTISIIDLGGRTLLTAPVSSTNNISLDVQWMESGTYILQISNDKDSMKSILLKK